MALQKVWESRSTDNFHSLDALLNEIEIYGGTIFTVTFDPDLETKSWTVIFFSFQPIREIPNVL